MSIAKAVAVAAMVLLLCGAAPPPIFTFETDEFWLNLHHFLYVLGRAEAKAKDASRAAVSQAPLDSARAMQDLTPEQRKAWADAVTWYAKGLSLKDAIFDEPLPTISRSLAALKNAASLPPAGIDPELRQTLQRAAPVYRAAWWPGRRTANREWAQSMQALIARDGPAILRFVTNAYAMGWPASGFPVHISGYANWAGAYSTAGNLLVVATNPGAGTRELNGLETIFHEAMHQWDDQMIQLLEAAERRTGAEAPRNLSHALIFFTAGEAVRRVEPGYIPYAEAFGVWQRGMMQLREALLEAWKPYLDGSGSRDAALDAVVRRASHP